MQEGNSRREELLMYLSNVDEPVSGNVLAKRMGVSRQIIVQDIALLRAQHIGILSTTKGYMLSDDSTKPKRAFMVHHGGDEIEDELNTIVDCGGKVLDVTVEHNVYGTISGDLMISHRKDVEDFVKRVREDRTVPLMGLTNGVHYHAVEADSQEILDYIEQKLFEKGYLIQKS